MTYKIKLQYVGKYSCWMHFDDTEAIDYLVGKGLQVLAFGNGGYGHNRIYFTSYPKTMDSQGIKKEMIVDEIR